MLAFGRWVDNEMSCLECQCQPEEEPDATIGTEWRILRHTAALLLSGAVGLAVCHWQLYTQWPLAAARIQMLPSHWHAQHRLLSGPNSRGRGARCCSVFQCATAGKAVTFKAAGTVTGILGGPGPAGL